MATDNSSSMMVLLVIYGFKPTDLSDSIGELKKQTKNLGTHSQRQAYWSAYGDIQSSANKYSQSDVDGGKLYGLIKYYSGSTSSNDNKKKEKGKIEFEPFSKRQKALVGTPKLMMGRHIKLLMKEGDEDDASKKGNEFIMPWFGDEAEEAYLDITQGEECISIDSDRGVYVSTKIKRKNCSAGSSSLKSIDGVQDYISKLEPDTPLQSIAWEGHQPPKVTTYNVILTGAWPSSVTSHLSMDESLAHINTSSMDEIYELFLLRRNNQYIREAETLIDSMVTEQNKSKGTDMTASIFTGSMKDLATANRNAILKKVYVSSTKKKFIQLARAEGGIEMIIVNEREGNDAGKFEKWGGVVFETYYKLDLSIYG